MSNTPAIITRPQTINRRLHESLQAARRIRSQVNDVIRFLNPDILSEQPDLPERKVNSGWLPIVEDQTLSIEHEINLIDDALRSLHNELGSSTAIEARAGQGSISRTKPPLFGTKPYVAGERQATSFPPRTEPAEVDRYLEDSLTKDLR